jgi:hypothetical protein
MQTKSWSREARRRLPWVLAAVLAAAAAVPAAASAGSPHREGVTSWATYHPKGWSAGSVRRGTGYVRKGASRRVREVQRRLNRLGYGAGKVDGLFGPITDAAVHHYQRDHALSVDGVVGPQTLKDLRTRTRRAQGLVDRQTQETGRTNARNAARTIGGNATPTQSKAKRPARTAAAAEPGSSWPAWWKLTLLAAAIVGGGFLAAVLLLRGPRPYRRAPTLAIHPGLDEEEAALYAEGLEVPPAVEDDVAAWDLAEELSLVAVGSSGGPAGPVASMSARRDEPRMGGSDISRPTVGEGSSLRIVRRIGPPEDTATADDGPSGAESARNGHEAGPRFPKRFRWFGARVHLADEEDADSKPGTLLVRLELFAENENRRWETGLVEVDEPFRVSIDDLEESVRDAVVPYWLHALAEALERDGVALDADQLARLPFAVEPSVEVERVLVERGLLGN